MCDGMADNGVCEYTSRWATDHPNDVFSILEAVVTGGGFNWRGKVPSVVTFERVRDSHAVQNYTDLLECEIVDGCSRRSDAAAIKFDRLQNLKDVNDWKCRVGCIVGVPGAGKTTLVKEFVDRIGSVCVVVPKCEMLINIWSGMNCAFCIDDLWTRPIEYTGYKTMVVDEFTECHTCEVLLLACYLGVQNLLFVGDYGQGLCYKPGSLVYYNFPIMAIGNRSRRMSDSVAKFYGRAMGTNTIGNGQAGEVIVEDLFGKLDDSSIRVCLTHDTQRYLAEDGIHARIAKEVQGQTFESVVLILNDFNDIEALCDRSTRTVAFSRASDRLIVKCGPVIRCMITNADYGGRMNNADSMGQGWLNTR